ncbi:MAG: amidohydrolase [Polyangia bacterium]
MGDELDLVEFRKALHRHPELSRHEGETAGTIADALGRVGARRVIRGLGGHGVAAVLEGDEPGPTVLLRADLDALPIEEVNDFEHRSEVDGVAHKCGHDGHMTILVGTAQRLLNRLDRLRGRVVLLFQPAEEIAHGAKAVVEDPAFERIAPDYVFGLHNLPGFAAGDVVLRKGEFASASQGLIARLRGRTSHAGEPHHGRTPMHAMTALMHALADIPSLSTPLERAALVTVIHARLGEIAFGTTPGYAEVMATFRSHRNEEMEQMVRRAESLVEGLARTHELESSTEWVEIFPAVRNTDECVDVVERAARRAGAEIVWPEFPFSWTEDFSYFLLRHQGAFFGLGAGLDQPQLHSPDYDFPDRVIPRGVEMMTGIVEELLQK